MTLIEIFDHSPLQNISGVFRFSVDKVYLAGSNAKKMSAVEGVFRKVWQRHGKNVEIQLVSIPTYDMMCAADKLCEIIRAEKEVLIDVSGGSDYLLAAAGIAYERCKDDGVQLHHVSVRSGKFVSFGNSVCKPDDTTRLLLTCDEIIELHGGKIVYAEDKKSGTVRWNFNADGFRDDVVKMWDICKRDNRTWNRSCARLGELENFAHSSDEDRYSVRLDVDVSKSYAYSKNKKQLISELTPHLEKLSAASLIKNYKNDGDILRFVFKNEQVRQCLLKAGNALELITYLAATEAKTKKGNKVYCDALSGVVLDWDGRTYGNNNTENEIDGLFIRGYIPVFVSCKNGGVDENELYKLNSVAEHFGTRYAKKVLVATDLQKNYSSLRFFKARADEMGITIIDGVHRMTFGELCKRLANA